jgi:hypothetical protein
LLTALSSFIRTVTVGSGVSPDLLTFFHNEKSARGLPEMSINQQINRNTFGIPPVGISTPP